ncbi:HlyD family efflux transporter periplasmic adaptor subunit [Modicisalibacter tunisiensis]|uniref:HlyD family secretion protein n=1 Tax=Modicisalibacter tunisiensis TaxID=390637 RepID=UPI001CCC2ADF|nr:HlyD family efflux transporter periplasmic adaptor subunit [Modicisalibacter tunisiensis]MBZ9540202.1 HlyD family efflux transporter periplasmic adaptor subunit [Modicisalibacter tunisiensis]
MWRLVRVGLAMLLLGGCGESAPGLPGTLEWDRITRVAEVSEPVQRWLVAEGERVTAGQPLLTLDPRRLDARLAQAEGELDGARAALAEARQGPRRETIAAARADLARARAAQTLADADYRRSLRLFQRQALASAELDQALALRDQRRAEADALAARLEELLRGERPERIAAATAAVAAARAHVDDLRVDRERLVVTAPRDGRVDDLPFRPGDQPPAGATLVSLLVGDAPYARFYVPVGRRATLAVGDPVTVHVTGLDTPFAARVESLAREPAFTPYYALAGDDASRLVYLARARLSDAAASRLAAGLPVRVELGREP